MSWHAKPSGTAAFERRDEPYLTDDMKDRLEREVIPCYETRLAASIPALHMIQHAYNWCPPQAIEEIAAFLGTDPGTILDTASFYEEFWTEPRGEHIIAVCRSMACEFCNAPEITKICEEELGIGLHETTEDGQFTLVELECLGSCGSAPVALYDEDLHEFVTPERMREIIRDAKAGKTPEVKMTTSDLSQDVAPDGH